ncbi:hypothetical protein EVAR_70266_1 [Eumeta japonica]|uniref:Uncharacterized protein n=1 Tax=Eumeta variegata TaxID=151549 RepID=A0A4C2ACE1_EUMVA|nr:hypothetical protein EVAR_70266_1 [Eumeta japonica]
MALDLCTCYELKNTKRCIKIVVSESAHRDSGGVPAGAGAAPCHSAPSVAPKSQALRSSVTARAQLNVLVTASAGAPRSAAFAVGGEFRVRRGSFSSARASSVVSHGRFYKVYWREVRLCLCFSTLSCAMYPGT